MGTGTDLIQTAKESFLDSHQAVFRYRLLQRSRIVEHGYLDYLSLLPHASQKRAPVFTGVPQEGQNIVS